MSGTATLPVSSQPQEIAATTGHPAARRGAYNLPIGYLRAFITVLVVAHHAVLAYTPFAPPAASLLTEPRLWRAFPVVDTHHWSGFGIFTGFNDTFFMALMFFLSGLFVWESLERKGTRHFLRDRAVRLGIPFVAAAAVVAPLAYYPAYLQTAAPAGVRGYLAVWLSQGDWPAGPAWFLWLLLAFAAMAAGLYALVPRWGAALGRLVSRAGQHPGRFYWLLAGASAAAYLPLVLIFDPFRWTTVGPFAFQTGRLLHYFVYYLAGIAVGAWGLQRGLLSSGGMLARRWLLWMVAAFLAFVAASGVFLASISAKSSLGMWTTLGGITFALSCAASSLAFCALFVRFVNSGSAIADSLRDNAYGIYILHYPCVSWLQYALLGAALSGLVKGVVVTLGAVAISWGATAALRRIPAVARVI